MRPGQGNTPWPKGFLEWREGNTLFISVVFTWDLPAAFQRVTQKEFDPPEKIFVGGPAIKMRPDYFGSLRLVADALKEENVKFGGNLPGVLQRHNPQATRTTLGCPRKCSFCAVPSIEGSFRELEDWPDLPILCDNNVLKAGQPHLDRVFDRLEKHGWCDFNQGLDARLLTDYHAERIKRVGRPVCRLALDRPKDRNAWEKAFTLLRKHKIPKNLIRSYVLVGYDTGPEECWERCVWVESHGVKALPQWYHEPGTLNRNVTTKQQFNLGWTDYERRRIMQWFYQHKEAAI